MNLEKNENKILFLIILFAIALFVLPFVMRVSVQNHTLIGEEAYYHTRVAGSILEGNYYDNLVVDGRQFLFNPYQFILAFFSIFFDMGILPVILPIIFGIVSLLLFYSIIKKFGMHIKERLLFLSILVLSPPTLYLFSISNSVAPAIFFILLGFFFFLKKKTTYLIFSIISFIIASFFGSFNSLFIIFLLFIYVMVKKEKQREFLITLFFVLLFYFIFHPDFFIEYRQIGGGFFLKFFSGFGAFIGFGIFKIILCVIGLITLFKEKSKYYPTYLPFIFLIVVSYFIPGANPYSIFFVSFFATYGFIRLIKLEWHFEIIRNLTILLVLCGLLFSTLSYANRLSALPPNDDIITSLEWLKENSENDSIVFSHHTAGYWIEEESNRKILFDNLLKYTSDFNKKIKDGKALFYSMDLQKTRELLEEHDISYIFVYKDMKEGLVWKDEQEGLLFLFRNNETFKNVYKSNYTDIWKIVKTE